MSSELRLGNSWDATTVLQSVGALADTIIILDLMDDLTRACKTTDFIEKYQKPRPIFKKYSNKKSSSYLGCQFASVKHEVSLIHQHGEQN